MNVDLSLASRPDGLQPSDLQNPGALFGLHEGLDAMLKLFNRFDIKATFTVPGAMAQMLTTLEVLIGRLLLC